MSIAYEEPVQNAWEYDFHTEDYFLGTTLLTQVGCRTERTPRYPPKRSNARIKYFTRIKEKN